MGVIYAESGDSQRAIAHFRLVPVKSNFYRDAQINIAQYFQLKEAHGEAVKTIENAVKERPDELDLYLYLASLI